MPKEFSGIEQRLQKLKKCLLKLELIKERGSI
jgi:hypothetical protein